MIALLALLLGEVAAAAEASSSNSMLDSRFTLGFGGFFPYIDSGIRLDPTTGGTGTEIDVEDFLGLDDTSPTWWATGRWRFANRHKLTGEYFELNRRGFTLATGSAIIGDKLVSAGAELASDFTLDVGRLTYGYNLVKDDDKELGLLLGIHVANPEAVILLSGNVSGIGSIQTPPFETGEIVFPLPHVGADFGYAFTPKLAAQIEVLAFKLDLGSYKGSLIEVSALAQYQLFKNFSLGTGLKYFNLDFEDRSDPDLRGKFEYDYVGPVVYGVFNF